MTVLRVLATLASMFLLTEVARVGFWLLNQPSDLAIYGAGVLSVIAPYLFVFVNYFVWRKPCARIVSLLFY